MSQHVFTVAEYMALDIPAHTELLGGVIYDVSPKNAPHGFAIRRLKLIWKGSCQEALLEIFGPWISFRKMNRTGQRTNSMLLDGGSD